jgi:UDP-glucose 4-epimerase
LDKVFTDYEIHVVMHMAAETVVEESMTHPEKFFQINVSGGLNLLRAMRRHNVSRIIFSSSCVVYGEPQRTPIDENHPVSPINVYGDTKLMFEHILERYRQAYGLRSVSLRYFNAAGASRRFGEDHRPESHLIPSILKAASNGNGEVSVFGTDYPTRDGSCIRDYVHVIDIGRAHILAMEKIDNLSSSVYNLGSGCGYSVLEVLAAAEKVTGRKIATRKAARRDGDAAALLADPRRARAELGWKPELTDIDTIIQHSWDWMRRNPDGYEE